MAKPSPINEDLESTDSLIDKVRKDALEGAKKSYFFILLGIGIFFIVVGLWLSYPPAAEASLDQSEKPIPTSSRLFWAHFAGEFLVRVGELLVLGFFLEMLLHSNHYGKFYLHLVEQAMLGDRLVGRLGKSAELWKRVSGVYFSQRFPKIYDRLTETLYSYFPTEHPYYLEDYNYRVTLSSLPGTFIKSTEEVSYRVVPAEGTDRVRFKFQNVI